MAARKTTESLQATRLSGRGVDGEGRGRSERRGGRPRIMGCRFMHAVASQQQPQWQRKMLTAAAT
jgi:hypothetical protein